MHHVAALAAVTTVAAQLDPEGDVEELQEASGAWETVVASLPRVGIVALEATPSLRAALDPGTDGRAAPGDRRPGPAG